MQLTAMVWLHTSPVTGTWVPLTKCSHADSLCYLLLASISCWCNSQVTSDFRQIRLKWLHCNVIYSCHVVMFVESKCKTSSSLTHWGRVTHICVGYLTTIGSDNGLSPDRRQAIIWTNARLLSIGPLRTYFNEYLIKIQQFPLKKMHLKMSSAKWSPSCLGLNVLICYFRYVFI